MSFLLIAFYRGRRDYFERAWRRVNELQKKSVSESLRTTSVTSKECSAVDSNGREEGKVCTEARREKGRRDE